MTDLDAKTVVCSLLAVLEEYSLEELYSKKEWARQYIMERGGGDDVIGFFELAFEVVIKDKKKEVTREKDGTAV